jgi:hypothetical protein
MHHFDMSTVAEIEAAIERLPPEEFRALREWIVSRDASAGRQWSPEELGAAAERMVAEEDPANADALAKRIVGGFYGDGGA